MTGRGTRLGKTRYGASYWLDCCASTYIGKRADKGRHIAIRCLKPRSAVILLRERAATTVRGAVCGLPIPWICKGDNGNWAGKIIEHLLSGKADRRGGISKSLTIQPKIAMVCSY